MMDLVAGETYETFEGEPLTYIGEVSGGFLFADSEGHEITLTLDDLQSIYPQGTFEEQLGQEMSESV
jgi:hypothetical protein